MARRKTTDSEKQTAVVLSPTSSVSDQIQRFPVVGVGASAGGLEAFSRLLSGFPAVSGLAFILVPHLDPKHKSLMVELLARQTALCIKEAVEGAEIEVDHIYVIPPNSVLTISRGCLHLDSPAATPTAKTAIDPLLCSLAEELGERSIGVILSGTGSHGSAGIKQIKFAGGLTLVQSPDTASFEQMPRNAIATGAVDFVLTPEQMTETLLSYVRSPKAMLGQNTLVDAPDESTPLARIMALLHAETKLDYRSYRKSMILRRIYRRMSLASIDQLADYLQLLLDQPAELSALNKDLLINVSAFFREPRALAIVQQQIITELVERASPESPVRIWIPGCATGEEAWTLAMLMQEGFEAAHKSPQLQIFATDVETSALNLGRRGIYPASITQEVSKERLQRFFIKQLEGEYKIVDSLRSYVVFAPQNLLGDPPFSQLDVISCQNLLIYLEQEAQRKIIALFHFGLKENGYLILGPSESLRDEEDNQFKTLSRKWRIFQRQGSSPGRLLELPSAIGAMRKSPNYPQRLDFSSRQGVVALMHQVLLRDYTPASVLIDRHQEALCFHGPTADYLEIPAGDPTRNLVAMVRQGLRTRLRSAIHRALVEQHEVVFSDVRVARQGQYYPCTLKVVPVADPGSDRDLLLVTFVDRPSLDKRIPAEEAIIDDSIIQQLEHELKVSREDLHSNIEALELANEELKASNEEAMSMNEEMQSTNEELETSGEELQSLNEELINSNNQLQEKIDELTQSNDNIANLLVSSDIGTLFLDQQLRIKLFTPAMQALLSLLDRDIGRPLSDFDLKLNDKRLSTDCQQVLDQSSAIEREVVADSGKCYLRRILPYRTQAHRIDGLVITFVDITARRAADAEKRRLAQVLEDSNDAVIVHDLDGTIQAWNQGATQLYGYSETEMLGSHVRQLIPESAVVDTEPLVRSLARESKSLSVETTRQHQDGHLLTVWATLTAVFDDAGRVVAIATTERDISAIKQLEQELRALNNSLEQKVQARTQERRAAIDSLMAMYRAAPVGLCMLDAELRFQSVNDRLADKLLQGVAAADVVGQSIQDVAPDLGKVLVPLLQQALQNAGPISDVELQLPLAGEPCTLLCYCQPIYTTAGGLEGISVALQDITERKATEQTLKEKEEHVTAILNTVVDAIISIDKKGLIELFNPAAEKMFGYSAEEALGQDVSLLMPPPHRAQHQAHLAGYSRNNRRSGMVGKARELIATRSDGSCFPISLSVGEVDHRQSYTGVIRDLSQNRALQLQLLSIAEQTQRQIGLALHDDIGQEMTGLTLKAETLCQQLQDANGTERDYAANIVSSLDRTRKKIRILSHGLIPVAVDANGLTQALEALVEEANDSLGFDCRFSAGANTAVDDPEVSTQLYHIAQEAIGNAMRHSQGQHIGVTLKRESRGMTLVVEDDGQGISNKAGSDTGSGFSIMQYRASMIDAQLNIVNSKTGGLKIICCLLNGEDHARNAAKKGTKDL